MKTKITYVTFILFIVVLASCKKPNHYIRVQNASLDTVINITVWSNSYGTLYPGQFSDYQHVPEGTLSVFGEAKDNGQLIPGNGTVSIYGHGTHYWTVEIDANGNFQLFAN